ncbi:MAG: methyltransferase [Planctomycetaceae bacterium]
MTDDLESDVRTPRAEQLLIEATAEIAAERVLCTSLGWGQLATSLAAQLPSAQVACHFLDLHPYEQARHIAGNLEARVVWLCSADLPEGPFDLAAIPVSRFGEAELTRDMLQEAYERLTEEGLLVTAVDNRDDKWLHEELAKLFAKVTREPGRSGVVYRAIRRGPLKRRRDFRCEFAFRDQGRLVKAVSRPGVFSHRELDLGARALLEVMEVRAGDRVVDMGCGSGVVGLAAALRAERVFVQGIDSNARAVACMAEGARLNEISLIGRDVVLYGRPEWMPQEQDAVQPTDGPVVRLDCNADGRVPEPGTYDLVVGNPPYYSHYQIAEIFLQAAKRALKPGGRVHIVTKKDDWHLARMPQLFTDVKSREVRGYKVVSATAR